MSDESKRRVEVLQSIMNSRELTGHTGAVEDGALESLTTEYSVTLSFVEWVALILYIQESSNFIPEGLITNPIVVTAYEELNNQIEEAVMKGEERD